MVENPLKIVDLGVALFQETSNRLDQAGHEGFMFHHQQKSQTSAKGLLEALEIDH